MPFSQMTIYSRAPGIRIDQYHGGSKSERARVLRRVQHRGGVCLTSYGMLVNHSQELAEKDGRGFVWVSRVIYIYIYS